MVISNIVIKLENLCSKVREATGYFYASKPPIQLLAFQFT
jgi:hypothetical protein